MLPASSAHGLIGHVLFAAGGSWLRVLVQVIGLVLGLVLAIGIVRAQLVGQGSLSKQRCVERDRMLSTNAQLYQLHVWLIESSINCTLG